jgi:hypothetical protein
MTRPMIPHLDDGGLAIFEAELERCTSYAEYGSGGSTLFVDARSSVPCVSVESDPKWAREVRKLLQRPECAVIYVDVGPVGRWGTPRKLHKHMDAALRYPDAIFDGGAVPDLVLIDGRFRVGCFLQCYQRLREGAVVLVDDYAHRREYWSMGELLPPADVAGRMAKFVLPSRQERRAIPLALAYRAALSVR